MGRECRRVPADWQHPRDEDGDHKPLLAGSYEQAAVEWKQEFLRWEEGWRRDFTNDGWRPLSADEREQDYWEWAGMPPEREGYMPHWTPEEATHHQMYENVSKGTPISPAFPTPEELARWLADNKADAGGGMTASYEGWLRVARGGYAPSLVMHGGTVLNGVDGLPAREAGQ